MQRFLLDSGIASDFVNHRLGIYERVLEAGRTGDRIGIPTVVLGELLGGIHWSQTAQKNLQRLKHHLRRVVIWPFDAKAAYTYGQIYAQLRQLGRPMQQIDMQLAAVAISLGNTTVITKDSDLAAVPGLKVTNWAAAED